MNIFETHFQNPFEKKVRALGFLDPIAVLQQFKQIDWLTLNNETFEKHDLVVEDFYFYEVKYQDEKQQENTILISGEYTYGDALAQDGPLFTIRYARPIEYVSRGFLGLGAERLKVKTEITVMEGCTQDFSERCVLAFIQYDKNFLETHLIHNESSSAFED